MASFLPGRLGGGGGRRRGGPRDDEDNRDHTYTKEDIAGLKYEPTTSFGLANNEELMVCPYDPVHVVPSSTTFYKHKLKCERKLKEQQGIPDAFNEMQYRNRYKSSLANQKPLPAPPVHVADLSLMGLTSDHAHGYGPSNATGYPPTSTAGGYYWGGAGPGLAEPSAFTRYVPSGPTAVMGEMGVHPHAHPVSPSPYAYIPDPAGGPGPSGTTESGIPLQVLGMAASNLRYFEPSGLTPAMRREFRARRRAAAGYGDESPPSPAVTPNETSIPVPPAQRPRTAVTVKEPIIEFTPSAYFKVDTTNEGAVGVDKIQKQFAGIGLQDKDGNGRGNGGDLKYEEEEEEVEEEEVGVAEKEVMEEVEEEEVIEEEEELVDEDDDQDVVLYYDDSD